MQLLYLSETYVLKFDYPKFSFLVPVLKYFIIVAQKYFICIKGKVKFIPVVPFSYWGIGVRKDIHN